MLKNIKTVLSETCTFTGFLYHLECVFAYDIISMRSQDRNVNVHDIIGKMTSQPQQIFLWHHNPCSNYDLVLFYFPSIKLV